MRLFILFRERKLRPLRADKIKEDKFAKIKKIKILANLRSNFFLFLLLDTSLGTFLLPEHASETRVESAKIDTEI